MNCPDGLVGCMVLHEHDRGVHDGGAAKSVPEPRTPAYYIGHGNMHASDVVDAFDLNDNWRRASAFSYLIRAGRKKEDTAIRDLECAIHFLQSEIAYLQGKRGKETMEIAK